MSTEEDVIEISKIPCVNLDSIQKQLDLAFYDRAPGKDISNQVIHTQTVMHQKLSAQLADDYLFTY